MTGVALRGVVVLPLAGIGPGRLVSGAIAGYRCRNQQGSEQLLPDRLSQSALIGQAYKLEAILESAVDAIITIDGSGIIMEVNPAAARLFGYEREDFTGKNVNFLMPEPYRSGHDHYIDSYRKTGRRKIIGMGREVTGQRRDGSTFPMNLSVSEFQSGGSTYFTGIIHDLTSRVAAEAALHQAQKMEAMGQLTGGIAHDFNNLLTVVMGNLEMLRDRLTTPLQHELVDEALEAADLGARLTSRLLAFSRRSHLEPEVVNLNGFVVGLTDMLHRTLGETVYLSNALSPDLWFARVDPSQVESAIVNLAVNARDAMPDGGRLVLETGNHVANPEEPGGLDGLLAGEYVRLSVSDTGVGMPVAVRERAFEPFFTTKEKGRGTGLGLSMIYGFAKQSGGHASIQSEAGMGTTVNLYLPRYVSHETHAVAVLPPDAPRPETGQTILAVEDDERVRKLTVTRLRHLGYEVLEASSGAEALLLLETSSNVDLLFTDVVMPGGMSGSELSVQVRSLFPGTRILLTSGYSEELASGTMPGAEGLKVLRKPYRQADLARAISEALKA
jgi:PAS domain S-box-containing protein